MTQPVTRFAPSPTGLPHLGHAYSALFGWDAARRGGGIFLLRFEDIDPNRCRPEFEEAFLRDLAWLGLSWPQPVRRQSEHMADYRTALDRLSDLGVLYPCFCSRKDIQDEIARAGAAPHGPEGPLYPGTCRHMDPARRADLLAAGAPHALRLDVAAAAHRTGPLRWTDLEAGTVTAQPGILGDVVLARRDVATSYHLAVTVDDHLQGVTLVTRGRDLMEATHVHRLLQALLDLNVPDWHHHRLLVNERGERLAKRDGAASLAALRDGGATPADIRRRLGMD
ncbi:tRNA glutamyl-Q(34) synthetase GluQRS [Nitrospirillum sp. BR 11828]|uniref:tRNA glutamyl-Q(34) synthetase GluQRS n=1 Tax=Nitrospirillum sp. BR 11828 TaxID=3104325 RepID=UPI002ACAB97E|nr:tRNA glutamyl-Q(34) synthetase GluQRS [Nitrospirillum sp. BR 11828]MDZ5646386.1 tRNA glutamyl-Q(34) synthetase GluQRS [Nitrospirillum sp. BR 11828]